MASDMRTRGFHCTDGGAGHVVSLASYGDPACDVTVSLMAELTLPVVTHVGVLVARVFVS